MNKIRKARWLRDLRSGKFKQAHNVLMREDAKGNVTHCCLAVLACGTKGLKSKINMVDVDDHSGSKVSEEMTLSDLDALELLGPITTKQREQWGDSDNDIRVLNMIQEHLTNMNDVYELSFKKIANWIEKEL